MKLTTKSKLTLEYRPDVLHVEINSKKRCTIYLKFEFEEREGLNVSQYSESVKRETMVKINYESAFTKNIIIFVFSHILY